MLGLRVPATPEVARAVRLTYGFQFFFGLLLWIPIFYEYQKQLGLSDAEIFGIQSIYYVAFCLLEIPTGLVADRFDYRTSLWLGASVLVVANLVPVLAGNYTGFLVHFLLIALARSLISGAQSAYLYEYLHAHDAGHLYLKVEGVGRSYSLVGKIVYWPVIGLLMQWNMPSPYWLTAINAAIAVVLALRLPPIPGWQRPEGKTSKLLAGVGGAFGSLRTSRWLLLLMIQGIAMFTLVRILQVNLFQPVLESKDVPVGWYGSVLAAMTIFEAIAAARPHWLSRRIGPARSVFLLTVVMALAIGFIVPSGGVVTIVLLCLFSVTAGMSFPIQKKLLNDAIPDSRYRATLLSMESIMDRAVCAVVAVALGAYLTGGRLDEFLVLSSVVTVIVMALLAGLLIAVRTTRRRRAQLVP
ncbi:Predicted arabinose efflux permease, MFS family [Lentzea waywayandensis]|uniref:Predicted arabinose efflux permease, MFS family n=1 Tax=Lentzea waywayandensis TaxID=84724 RepID=A0A1I6F1D7_9PSEU|nr:MFS transporter [Lentzea waywayandensis]SFR23768.1 Predicted arabinose efflux permease, MFS family [Lentzea waywayandensis]